MIAETAYNVVCELPEREMLRLYKMMRVRPVESEKPGKKSRKQPVITREQATEELINHLRRKKRKNGKNTQSHGD